MGGLKQRFYEYRLLLILRIRRPSYYAYAIFNRKHKECYVYAEDGWNLKMVCS